MTKKEEAILNKTKEDRLYYDEFLKEYFTIRTTKKSVWDHGSYSVNIREKNMRDINRIPKICKELEELWLKHPDLRLGQLILNAFSLHNGVDKKVYYMEDDEFIKELKKTYGEDKKTYGEEHSEKEEIEEILIRVKDLETRTNKSIDELCKMNLSDMDNFYDKATIIIYKSYKEEQNKDR